MTCMCYGTACLRLIALWTSVALETAQSRTGMVFQHKVVQQPSCKRCKRYLASLE